MFVSGNTSFNEKPYFEQKRCFSAKYVGWTEVGRSSGSNFRLFVLFCTLFENSGCVCVYDLKRKLLCFHFKPLLQPDTLCSFSKIFE